MRFGLSEADREFFDRTGFLVAPNVLSTDQVGRLTELVDRLYKKNGGDARTGRMELRNCVTHDPMLLEMAAHPAMLSVVVDLLGPNIKLRTSELDVRPPLSQELARNELGRGRWGEPEQWHIDGPLYLYPAVDGIVPMMEVRVGFYLSDLTGPESGALCVAAGTHKLDYRLLMDPDYRVPEASMYYVRVPPGSAILFRTGLWHCTSPNLSALTRKVLYYAYTYRWIEPSDYMEQPPSVLERCTPVQKQLLGAPISPERHPLGENPDKIPCSFYWFTRPEDIPIAGWRETLNGSVPDFVQACAPNI